MGRQHPGASPFYYKLPYNTIPMTVTYHDIFINHNESRCLQCCNASQHLSEMLGTEQSERAPADALRWAANGEAAPKPEMMVLQWYPWVSSIPR